ncbi:MAG: LysR family transcriptional regulator [Clostridia bacterium]|nr:LysR family transcriptional regulator [Clostridia bacterium]
MTLMNLRYFLEAARCGSFTEAARNLYVSQPGLSKQIALVEKEVGVPLFVRANRSVRLTPAGEYLYEQMRDILSATDHVFERARAIGLGLTGSLSIGYLDAHDQPDTLGALSARFPDLDLYIEKNSFSNLRSGLLSGRYDLIVTLSFETETLPDIGYQTLRAMRGALAINRANPKSQIEALSLDLLRDEPFVSISEQESPGGLHLLIKQCEKHGFTPRIVRQFSSQESLMLAVEAGLGVTILENNARLFKSDAVRIATLPDSDFSHLCAIWLAQNGNAAIHTVVEALREDD